MSEITLGIGFNEAYNLIFCKKCGERGYEHHHITYIPEEIALLCTKCHLLITKLNTIESRKSKKKLGYYKKLSNKVRKRIWEAFLDG